MCTIFLAPHLRAACHAIVEDDYDISIVEEPHAPNELFGSFMLTTSKELVTKVKYKLAGEYKDGMPRQCQKVPELCRDGHHCLGVQNTSPQELLEYLAEVLHEDNKKMHIRE